MLAGLAWHGPLRQRDCTNLTGFREPSTAQLDQFVASGLVVKFGDNRARMMALNPNFPALHELRALVRAVEPQPPEPTLPLSRDLVVPRHDVTVEAYRELFGPWRQTAILLIVASSGGEVARGELEQRMLRIGTKKFETGEALEILRKRRLVVGTARHVRVAPTFAAAGALVAFARAFTTAVPSYRLEIPTVTEQPQLPEGSNYGYRGEGIGIAPLFGRPGRYRVLAALAIYGSLGRSELMAASVASPNTIDRLVAKKWIYSQRSSRANVARVALQIANVPARNQLLPLLKRMAERWPPRPIIGNDERVRDPGPPVKVPMDGYFGSPVLSETLLTTAAMGRADIQMVHRSVHRHDRHEIVRALETFDAFGIMRRCRLDGRDDGGYELNPDWFAAAELQALLDALLDVYPRYRSRARGAEAIMPPRRLKRKLNATKHEGRKKPTL
jgi:hypothetical protein